MTRPPLPNGCPSVRQRHTCGRPQPRRGGILIWAKYERGPHRRIHARTPWPYQSLWYAAPLSCWREPLIVLLGEIWRGRTHAPEAHRSDAIFSPHGRDRDRRVSYPAAAAYQADLIRGWSDQSAICGRDPLATVTRDRGSIVIFRLSRLLSEDRSHHAMRQPWFVARSRPRYAACRAPFASLYSNTRCVNDRRQHAAWAVMSAN
jgi:hypothetical protein